MSTYELKNVFDFQAEVGITKHIGGRRATLELIDICQIDKDKYVLDVGCGVGMTAVYLAKTYNCKVAGVDIHPRMIDRARERAEREKVDHLTEFRAADVQDLPFEDSRFDAVLCESVTAFPKDKQKAVDEYARVVKTGGFVGLNEATWLQSPPPRELVEWVQQELSDSAILLNADGWTELLEKAGLKVIKTDAWPIKVAQEAGNIMKHYGFREMLRVWGRSISLAIKDPAARALMKGAGQSLVDKPFDFFGYGLYVGRKPE